MAAFFSSYRSYNSGLSPDQFTKRMSDHLNNKSLFQSTRFWGKFGDNGFDIVVFKEDAFPVRMKGTIGDSQGRAEVNIEYTPKWHPIFILLPCYVFFACALGLAIYHGVDVNFFRNIAILLAGVILATGFFSALTIASLFQVRKFMESEFELKEQARDMHAHRNILHDTE